MTARPVNPESRRGPVYAAVALVLVMVAVLLAAGCVSQGFDNQNTLLSKEKYVFLEHRINESSVTVSGTCYRGNPSYYCGKIYNMSNSVLTVYPSTNRNATVNESLILFYGQQYRVGGAYGFDCGNNGLFVYSLPWQFSNNIMIESVTDDGTVKFRFMDSPVILKPNERWENISSIRIHIEKFYIGGDEYFPECTEDRVNGHSFYNAGFLDKKTIVLQEPKQGPESALENIADMFMNWTGLRGEP